MAIPVSALCHHAWSLLRRTISRTDSPMYLSRIFAKNSHCLARASAHVRRCHVRDALRTHLSSQTTCNNTGTRMRASVAGTVIAAASRISTAALTQTAREPAHSHFRAYMRETPHYIHLDPEVRNATQRKGARNAAQPF